MGLVCKQNSSPGTVVVYGPAHAENLQEYAEKDIIRHGTKCLECLCIQINGQRGGDSNWVP